MAFGNWKKGIWCAFCLGLLVAATPVRAEVEHYIVRFKIGTMIVGTGEFDYDPEPAASANSKMGTVTFTAHRNAGGAYDITANIFSQHHLAEGCTPGNPCPSRIRTIVGSGPGHNTVPADTNRILYLLDNNNPNDRRGVWQLKTTNGRLLRHGTTHWSDTAEPVPEPPIALLFISGGLILVWFGYRRRRLTH